MGGRFVFDADSHYTPTRAAFALAGHRHLGRARGRARRAAAQAAGPGRRRERDLPRARRRVDTVHHLLDKRFQGGPWSTAVIAFQATRGSIYEQSTAVSDTVDKICASRRCPTSRASAARAASRAVTSATSSARRTRRRRSPTTRRRRCCWSRSSTARTTPSRCRATSPRSASSCRSRPANPVRSFVTGPGRLRRRPQRRGRGDRRDAAGDHDGARPRPDAADLPLAADRGADAGAWWRSRT